MSLCQVRQHDLATAHLRPTFPPASRLVFGTDYPLPAQDDLCGRTLAALGPAERGAVSGANAARLLGLAAERTRAT